MDDSIAEQLAARDRIRKKQAEQRTPAERLRLMAQLQESAWHLLRSSPEGYAHFLKRNFKARAVDVPDANAP